MFPTLNELFHALFGISFIPLPTFGFFVALSFISAAWIFTIELKRKEEAGLIQSYSQKMLVGSKATITELLSSALFGFIVGFKLVYAALNWHAFSADPRGILLSTEGNWLMGILGALLFAGQTYRQKQKALLEEPKEELVIIHPFELVSNMTMVAAISGIIGARVFHILENWNDFVQDPSGMIFSTGGFTFYGGLIFGAIAVISYANRYKISTLHLIDACAPGLMLAYGVGRIGCHMSGDGDWGINNPTPAPSFIPDWMWSFRYPHNVIGEGIPIPDCSGHYCAELPVGVYPTALYEAFTCIALFFLLWLFRKKFATPGHLFCLYLILNGLERFFIEKIRVNTVYNLFGHHITQAEIISTLLVIVGITGLVVLKNKSNLKTDHAT